MSAITRSFSGGRSLYHWAIPQIVSQAYLTSTVLIFAFGPWPWPIENKTALYGYILAGQISLLLGYCTTLRARSSGSFLRTPPDTLLLVAALANFALLVPTLVFRQQLGIGVLAALQNPGEAYLSMRMAEDSGSLALEVSRLFLGPATVMLAPLTFYYWANLRASLRVLSVALISANLVTWIVIGTNKGMGDLIILLFGISLLKLASGRWRPRVSTALGASFGTVLLLGLFLLYFTKGQEQRGGEGSVPEFLPTIALWSDDATPIARALPESLRGGFRAIAGYTSQGYYGLSLSLRHQPKKTAGMGHSLFLQNAAARVLGADWIRANSIPGQVDAEDGWDILIHWHTIYPWLASDIGWIGALVAVAALGRLFGLVWIDAYEQENPIAVVLVGLLWITVIFISANNQMLQYPEGFSGFIGLTYIWYVTRRSREVRS